MKKPLPPGVAVALVIVAIVLVIGIGYHYMSGGPNADVSSTIINHYKQAPQPNQATSGKLSP